MGLFSWIYSDTNQSMIVGKHADSYLLVPPPFQNIYGKWIKEICYDGYGHMGGYDVYDLVLEWNREFLNLDMLQKPRIEEYSDERYFQAALKRYDTKVDMFKKYKTGASDDEMQQLCEKTEYIRPVKDWKRNMGIDIACYDEQNEALHYPIKITSAPMEYDDAKPSPSDPNQGCM